MRIVSEKDVGIPVSQKLNISQPCNGTAKSTAVVLSITTEVLFSIMGKIPPYFTLVKSYLNC